MNDFFFSNASSMVLPDACSFYIKRAPGVTAQKYIMRLPTNAAFTPGAHCQLQLPAVHGLDTRSAQITCDVSTSTSTGGPCVLPRYGAQMLIENSSLLCGGQCIGGQSNQFYNVYNHIAQDLSAGSTDQSKMSIYGGAADVPPVAPSGATSLAGPTWDQNGVYTPGQVSAYSSTQWAGSSQTTATQAGSNPLVKDSSSNITYSAGLPQVIEVFNNTLETITPSIIPSFLMQNLFVDIGFAPGSILIGPSGCTPSYTVQNVTLQCNVYSLGEEYAGYMRSFVEQGNLIQMPFKSVQAFPGPLSGGMDITQQFTVGTGSLDKLMCCFLDSAYRTPGPVVYGSNTSKWLTLGKGTGVKQMYWTINGQQNPSFPVGPRHAWGQTMTDLGLAQAGKGIYKNANSYIYYLTRLFVWAYSLQLPFAESPGRELSGLSTVNQNAQLALYVQSDPTNTAANLESYSCYPLVFALSTSVLNVAAGGQISVSV